MRVSEGGGGGRSEGWMYLDLSVMGFVLSTDVAVTGWIHHIFGGA